MKKTLKDALLMELLSLQLWIKGYRGHRSGLRTRNIDRLLNEMSNYDELHPLLLKWLRIFSLNGRGRELVVRLLGDAKDIRVAKVLLEEYGKTHDLYYKFVIANSIYCIYLFDLGLIETIILLVQNKEDNNARCPFLRYLYNSEGDKTDFVLRKIAGDELETKKMRELARYLLSGQEKRKKTTLSQKKALIAMEYN